MNYLGSSTRPALELVHGALDADVDWTWFCGHCAAPSPGGEPPAPAARVCRSCSLGLLLETRIDSAPAAGDAFVVVDAALRVQAMSDRAEKLLKVREDLAVNRPLDELLVPADSEQEHLSPVASAVAEAVTRGDGPSHVFVRPWNTFGVRVRARIVACGPPRAALIVLEAPRRGQLKIVRP